MLVVNRRGFVKWAGSATTAVWEKVNQSMAQFTRGDPQGAAPAFHSGESVAEVTLDRAEIYRLLGHIGQRRINLRSDGARSPGFNR